MVKAAIYAIDYNDKNKTALAEEIIKDFVKENKPENKRQKETQIYEVAAINKLCKIKHQYKLKTKKQIIQEFVNDLDAVYAEVEKGD